MKKLFFTLAILAGFIMQAMAYDFQVDGIYYNVSYFSEDPQVCVTHCSQAEYGCYEDDIVIPESVTYQGVTYAVTEIGPDAFRNCLDLTSVMIPTSVTQINARAFYGCTALQDIHIPNWMLRVHASAFNNTVWYDEQPDNQPLYLDGWCMGFKGEAPLSELSIEEGTIAVADAAFAEYESLVSVTLPNTLVSVGYYAFNYCSYLRHVDFGESIEEIMYSAFNECRSLDTVVLSETVTKLGRNTFRNCISLSYLILPNSIISIGECAFEGCSNLVYVDLPDSLTEIEKEVFDQSGLITITIPNGVTKIGDLAFFGCENLTSVIISETVTEIGYAAFICPSLDTVICLGSAPALLDVNTQVTSFQVPDDSHLIVPCGSINGFSNSTWGEVFTNITEDCGSGDDMLEAYCEAPFNFGGSPTTDQGIYGAQLWWNKPFASHWFHYDDKPYAGSAEAFEWGIRIPGEEIHAGDMLTHVAFYKVGCQNEVEQYDFAFSGGETEPENLEFLAWNSVLVEPGPDEWVMVKLRYPIICEEGRSLWIVMRAPFIAGNKAPYCQTSGNPDARWVSLIGGWYDYLAVEGTGGDWMIRGYFTNDMGYQEAGYNEELDHYNIYRGSSLEEMEKVAEVGRDEEEYFDTLQQPFGDYYYQLTASYTDGRESVPAKRSENSHSPDYVYFHVGNMSSLGSEWYYEIQDENGSITYQHLQYAADTTVNHKDVKIIIRTNTLYDKGEHSEVTREYIYEDFGKVYWWNETLQDFTLLYDLGAQTGDEWEIKVGTESIIMHVDTVEQYEYEGTTYRMLHVSDANNLFSGEIMSGIGHLTSFFPERLMSKGKAYRVEGIRCYWREGELVFKYGEKDCDEVYQEIHNGIEEDGPSIGSGTLTVYPNPTDGVLFVQIVCTPSLPYQTYRITNLMGQMVIMGTLDAEKRQIDVSNLPKGMYFISVGDMTRKFVVNE